MLGWPGPPKREWAGLELWKSRAPPPLFVCPAPCCAVPARLPFFPCHLCAPPRRHASSRQLLWAFGGASAGLCAGLCALPRVLPASFPALAHPPPSPPRSDARRSHPASGRARPPRAHVGAHSALFFPCFLCVLLCRVWVVPGTCSKCLTRHKFNVHTAEDGDVALVRGRSFPPASPVARWGRHALSGSPFTVLARFCVDRAPWWARRLGTWLAGWGGAGRGGRKCNACGEVWLVGLCVGWTTPPPPFFFSFLGLCSYLFSRLLVSASVPP